MTAAIELEGVSKVFGVGGREVAAIAGISLSVAPGEFVSIVGPSGCGKSTLLRIVGGLLPPTDGRALVRGLTAAPPCAFVFQENDLLPWRRARENVLLGMARTPVGHRSASRASAEDALRHVGLGAFADRFPGELSVGMRRRVSLARAFASGRDLLLMDEPFAAVDAQTRLRLQGDLLDQWSSRRPTVLFVTHDVTEAVRLGDRVVVLSQRPARVIADLPVPLARPRLLGAQLDGPAAALERTIWEMLAPAA